jgi:UDP-N-acetylmuramate dehydrogenase
MSGPPFRVVENADLRARNTFRVPARAHRLIEVDRVDSLPRALAEHPDVPLLVLGAGSNVLFTRDWPGVVLAVTADRIARLDDDGRRARIRVEAGANWNDFVRWSLAEGHAGLENLVLIPGNVGAAPIQNIGAYGVEVGEFVHAIHAYDRKRNRMVVLRHAECAFGYRDSVFKHEAGRYIVCAVEFELTRDRPTNPGYAGVREELAALGADPTDRNAIADAITRLRLRKLPDPAVIGNAGSFFKNPLVETGVAVALRARHPDLPVWPGPDGSKKLSAAWLVETCNFKGLRDEDAGVSHQHALVLVNHGRASGAQIRALAERIRGTVRDRFGVELEPEPRIV